MVGCPLLPAFLPYDIGELDLHNESLQTDPSQLGLTCLFERTEGLGSIR